MDANDEKPRIVPCPEIVNSTVRLSPFDDFMKRTMGVLDGIWAKLNYIRELRQVDGSYEHWGLTRSHGEAASQLAMADTHSELALGLLRTPIEELAKQLEIAAKNAGTSTKEVAERLYDDEQRVTPKDLRGGSRRHMHSVLLGTRLVSSEVSNGSNMAESPAKDGI